MKRTLTVLWALAAIAALAAPASAVELAGRGSIGASLGGMKFLSGEEFGEGEPRFIGQAMFRYNFTEAWSVVLESGWGWNAYPDDREDVDTLAQVVPTTIGFQYRTHYGETKLWPNVGAGIGLYSLGVKDTFRSWARADNGTEQLLWTSPGFYGRAGTEIIFSDGVAINVDLLYHQIFSKDEERFPDIWGNQNTSFAQFRVGLSYYFRLPGAAEADPDEDGDDDGS